MLVPGRHARLIDFMVDTLGACAGSAAGFVFLRALVNDGLGIWRLRRGIG
jgi:VanZ family protein